MNGKFFWINVHYGFANIKKGIAQTENSISLQ